MQSIVENMLECNREPRTGGSKVLKYWIRTTIKKTNVEYHLLGCWDGWLRCLFGDLLPGWRLAGRSLQHVDNLPAIGDLMSLLPGWRLEGCRCSRCDRYILVEPNNTRGLSIHIQLSHRSFTRRLGNVSRHQSTCCCRTGQRNALLCVCQSRETPSHVLFLFDLRPRLLPRLGTSPANRRQWLWSIHRLERLVTPGVTGQVVFWFGANEHILDGTPTHMRQPVSYTHLTLPTIA